ncbi:hypothetical protein H0X48_01775 [Candidatus Dependentiae bacterium]|nr:hypothetical protein [Candidatus Dependentiae bacterium]
MKHAQQSLLYRLYHHSRKKNYLMPLVLGAVFILLFITISMRYVAQARKLDDKIIAQNIEKLAAIFQKIHQCCVITGFAHHKNTIDFLNVISFKGDRLGSMELQYPEKWEGPYLEQPLVSNGKEYQVVSTTKGYFIVPGDGVKLSNGKVIGKDIIIDNTADVAALMRNPEALLSQGQPLAAPLEKVSIHQNKITHATDLDEAVGVVDY